MFFVMLILKSCPLSRGSRSNTNNKGSKVLIKGNSRKISDLSEGNINDLVKENGEDPENFSNVLEEDRDVSAAFSTSFSEEQVKSGDHSFLFKSMNMSKQELRAEMLAINRQSLLLDMKTFILNKIEEVNESNIDCIRNIVGEISKKLESFLLEYSISQTNEDRAIEEINSFYSSMKVCLKSSDEILSIDKREKESLHKLQNLTDKLSNYAKGLVNNVIRKFNELSINYEDFLISERDKTLGILEDCYYAVDSSKIEDYKKEIVKLEEIFDFLNKCLIQEKAIEGKVEDLNNKKIEIKGRIDALSHSFKSLETHSIKEKSKDIMDYDITRDLIIKHKKDERCEHLEGIFYYIIDESKVEDCEKDIKKLESLYDFLAKYLNQENEIKVKAEDLTNKKMEFAQPLLDMKRSLPSAIKKEVYIESKITIDSTKILKEHIRKVKEDELFEGLEDVQYYIIDEEKIEKYESYIKKLRKLKNFLDKVEKAVKEIEDIADGLNQRKKLALEGIDILKKNLKSSAKKKFINDEQIKNVDKSLVTRESIWVIKEDETFKELDNPYYYSIDSKKVEEIEDNITNLREFCRNYAKKGNIKTNLMSAAAKRIKGFFN